MKTGYDFDCSLLVATVLTGCEGSVRNSGTNTTADQQETTEDDDAATRIRQRTEMS